MAGWGIHHIDIAQWGNGTELTGPVEIEGSARFPDDDALCDNPLSWDTRDEIRQRRGFDLHRVGAGICRREARHHLRRPGRLGVGQSRRHRRQAEIAAQSEPFGPDDVRLPVSTNHQGNFLQCVRTRQKTICNIDVAVRSDTVCQLAWCAFQLQRKLRWDPESELFVGDPEANRKLTRALRAPWRL